MTSLYRHFNAEGGLLYVGISLNTIARLVAHQKSSEWFGDIASITIEKFEDRDTADAAEITAIKAEAPKFNRRHVAERTATVIKPPKRKRLGRPPKFNPTRIQDDKIRALYYFIPHTLAYVLKRAGEIMGHDVKRHQLSHRYGRRNGER